MRPPAVTKALAITAVVAAGALALAAHFAYRSAISARLDRAEQLEAAAVRPAAAARLAAELAAHRLARVEENGSHAVAGAFRRADGEAALDVYRRAQGDPSVLEEARRAFAAVDSNDAAADVAFLRAMRALRAEMARAPSPARPAPPSSAARGARFLLSCAVAAAAGSLFAYLAGGGGSPTR